MIGMWRSSSLTGEQAAAYGRFEGEPSPAEPERFFFLDDAVRAVDVVCPRFITTLLLTMIIVASTLFTRFLLIGSQAVTRPILMEALARGQQVRRTWVRRAQGTPAP